MKSYSIIRGEEYKKLSQLELDGNILDVGGSKHSKYHQLIKGKNKFTVINLDKNCEPDFFVNIEKKFPFKDGQFDHAICLNVLEHVYEFEHVISEQLRCIKPNGSIVIATPFMYHIHGSPDDYMRYTASAYRRVAEKLNCTISRIDPIGYGFFSLGSQCTGEALPTNILRTVVRSTAIFLDKSLNKISKKYRKLTNRIPLGYFVVLQK